MKLKIPDPGLQIKEYSLRLGIFIWVKTHNDTVIKKRKAVPGKYPETAFPGLPLNKSGMFCS